MDLNAEEYGKIYQKGVKIIKELAGDRFEDVFNNGFRRGLDYHAKKHGLPRDLHGAGSRVTMGVAMAQFYLNGLDLDEIIRQDGTCYNPNDDYVR